MLTLIDGPAKGTYLCRRAPVYLRAVINATGEMDALDQVDDKPADDESIYVYERDGEAGTVHLYYGGNKGAWYATGRYHYLPDVIGDNARDNAAWQSWATARAAAKDKPREAQDGDN